MKLRGLLQKSAKMARSSLCASSSLGQRWPWCSWHIPLRQFPCPVLFLDKLALQVRVELAELSPLLRVLWSTWAHYARAGRVLRRGQQQPLIKPVQISAWFLLVNFHELLRRPRLGALKPLLLLLYRQVRLLVYLFYFLVGVSHRLALVNKPCSLKAN